MSKSKVKIQIDRLKTKNCETKINTLKAIARLGEDGAEAASAVLEHIKHESFKVRTAAATTLGSIKVKKSDIKKKLLEAIMDDDASSVRNSAAWALGSICAKEDDYLPDVIKAYQDEKISIDSLAWIAGEMEEGGKDALPELQKAMGNNETAVRRVAFEAVSKINQETELFSKPAAKKVKEKITESVKEEMTEKTDLAETASDEEEIQLQVVESLEGTPEETEKALLSIIPAVRQRAVYTIGQSEYLPEDMIEKLVPFLRDEADIVRRETRDLFEKLGPAAVNVLIQQLKSSDVNMQETAMNLLEKTGESAKTAVPALVEFLESENSLLKSAALSALGGIGDPASQYVDQIIDCMYDGRVAVRRCAASALKRLENGLSDSQVSEVKLFVKDNDQWVRTYLDFLK